MKYRYYIIQGKNIYRETTKPIHYTSIPEHFRTGHEMYQRDIWDRFMNRWVPRRFTWEPFHLTMNSEYVEDGDILEIKRSELNKYKALMELVS